MADIGKRFKLSNGTTRGMRLADFDSLPVVNEGDILEKYGYFVC
jgi:hypothetical protein